MKTCKEIIKQRIKEKGINSILENLKHKESKAFFMENLKERL